MFIISSPMIRIRRKTSGEDPAVIEDDADGRSNGDWQRLIPPIARPFHNTLGERDGNQRSAASNSSRALAIGRTGAAPPKGAGEQQQTSSRRREQRSNGAGKPSAELKERLQRTAAPRPRHSQSRSSHSSMPKLLHTLCCCFRAADRKKNDSAGAGECCDARTSPISQAGKGPAGADRSSVVQMAGSLRQRLTTPREQKKDSGARFGARFGAQSSNNNNGTLGLAIGTQSTSASAAEQHRQQQKQQPPGGHHDQHQHFLLPRGTPQDAKRKCLIVDLDETLVHSSFKPVKNADFVIPVEIDNVVHQVYVLKRPHTDAFLERIGALFECVLFTASLAKYADPVADLLDKRRVFRARLFREACVFYEGNYVKDLERLGRDLRNVVIIDNSPASYAFHPDNAIPVRTWFDDPNDRELLDLLPLLEELAHADNIYAVLGTVPPSQQPRSLTPSEDMLLPPPMAPSSPITQVLPPANGQRAVTTIVTTAGAGRGAPEMRRAITMESVPVQRR